MPKPACRDYDPELWFPLSDKTATAVAIAICHTCPIQGACLTWALDHEIRDGIWGGYTEQERLGMTRRIDRRSNANPGSIPLSTFMATTEA